MMAWRRSSALISINFGRFSKHSTYRTLSPLVCSQSLSAPSSYFNQFRCKSNLPLQDLTDLSTGTNAVAPLETIFSDTAPVLAAQDLLYQLHDLTGLTWAPTVVLATVGVRVIFGLPLQIYQQMAIAKLKSLEPAIIQLRQDITRETSIASKIYNWDARTAQTTFKNALKKHWQKLIEENNCHPYRSIALSALQIPVWICLSSAIRNIAYKVPTSIPENFAEQQLRYMEMFVENTGWIESLALPDPFILPGIFVLANLINIQINRARDVDVPQRKIQKVMPWVFGGVVVGVGIFATYVPAAVSLFWATSSVSALAVNSAFKLPFVSTRLGYPRSSRKLFQFPSLKFPKLRKSKISAL